VYDGLGNYKEICWMFTECSEVGDVVKLVLRIKKGG